MKEIAKYSYCFVCGDQNDNGLRIKFYTDGSEAVARYTTQEEFQGYRGITHGGILATLLDEIMAKAIIAEGIVPVTAEMTVRFKKPTRTGDQIQLTGRVFRKRGRMYSTEAEARREDGQLLATATGKYIRSMAVSSSMGPGIKISVDDALAKAA